MLFVTKSWVLVYGDGGTGDGGTGDGGTGDGGTGDGGTGDGGSKPTLKKLIEQHGLQDEMNTLMATNRKTLTQKNQELVTQLTQLRETATMSTQAKEELEDRIEELQTQFMSKEEIAKRETENLSKNHAVNIDKLTSETKKWQGLYATSTIERSILDAAVGGEAIQPSHLVTMLGQNTQIVEELDAAGQGKGKYKTIVKFSDIDSDGNPVILELPPKEAITRMKELPDQYGYLFKGNAAGGLGADSGGGSGRSERAPKLQELMEDPVKYAEWRKKNPDLPIEKLKRK